MSTTLSLWCMECRASIWLGQRSVARHYIYAIDETEHTQLEEFLERHEGHPLMYGSLSVFEDALEPYKRQPDSR